MWEKEGCASSSPLPRAGAGAAPPVVNPPGHSARSSRQNPPRCCPPLLPAPRLLQEPLSTGNIDLLILTHGIAPSGPRAASQNRRRRALQITAQVRDEEFSPSEGSQKRDPPAPGVRDLRAG